MDDQQSERKGVGAGKLKLTNFDKHQIKHVNLQLHSAAGQLLLHR
jgi:hypothetical protein